MRRTTVCLTMIVRDEEHVIGEAIDSLAGRIDTYSIVDTGSADATIEVIRSEMAAIGVEGEIHERPWRDFGHNRSEALELARGRADYLWMFDADDLFIGDVDLGSLTADSYLMRIGSDFRYWRKMLFRSGPRWRFEGVVHEYPVCLDPASEERLEGDYRVESRRLGARSDDPGKYMRDAELLADELERDPDDSRSAYYLAQSLADAGEREAALAAFEQRMEMEGEGFDEEAFQSALRAGGLCEALGLPWETAQAEYLRAHEMRPHRAEPLHDLARHHRLADEHNLAYLYASRAAALPFPESEGLFVAADIYEWRALDELAVAAGQTGRMLESFDACETLLAIPALPEAERPRVEGNGDFAVPELLAASERYPSEIVARLAERGPLGDPEITLTITSCRRPRLFERTLNSFLNCCTDVERIGRFVCVDNGSAATDLDRIRERYPFLEVVEIDPDEHRHAGAMNRILELVDSPFWLQMEDDWQFFRTGPYVAEALAILEAEPRLAQVAFNRNYAETLEDRKVAGSEARTTPDGLRYRIHEWVPLHGPGWLAHCQSLAPGQTTNAHWPHFTLRPSLLRRDELDRVGSFDESLGDFELDFAGRFEAAGLRTGFLDRICSLHTGRLTTQGRGQGAPSAYELLEPSADLPTPTHRSSSEPREGAPPAVATVAINLDRRPERWAELQRHLAETGGERFAAGVRRFSAIDGLTLELDDAIRTTFEGNDFGWRRGVIACALSHMAVWKEVAESGQPTLILEDDARPEPGFGRRLGELVEQLEQEDREPDLVMLGYIGPRRWGGPGGRPSDLGNSDLELWPMRWERFWGGTWAYLLSPSGAARLLAAAERDGVRKGIDIFVGTHAGELRTLECVPALLSSPLAEGGAGSDSDIQYDGVALPGTEGLPAGSRPIGTLLDVALGSLILDVEPGWPLVDATLVAPDAEGRIRLSATTAEPGGDGRHSYLVTLGEDLEVLSVEPRAGSGPGPAPEFELDEGRLGVEKGGRSGHRFTLAPAEGAVLRSPAFHAFGDEETFGGLSPAGDRLLAIFSSQAGVRLALLDPDDVLEILEPGD